MSEPTYLKWLNILARTVGVFWIFGGLVFLISSYVSVANRLSYVAAGVFLLVAGSALLITKPIHRKDVDRFKRVIKPNDSTR